MSMLIKWQKIWEKVTDAGHHEYFTIPFVFIYLGISEFVVLLLTPGYALASLMEVAWVVYCYML